MATLREVSSQALQLSSDQFVLSLALLSKTEDGARFVAACSDDSLTIMDLTSDARRNPLITKGSVLKRAHSGLTCLHSMLEREPDQGKHIFLTGGRTGGLKMWYEHLSRPPVTFQMPKNEPISSVTGSLRQNIVVAGTDTDADRAGDVAVFVWDSTRPDSLPIRSFTEIHSNTITSMFFLPQPRDWLVTASTDSTISITDVSQEDEDEAQLTSVVHKAPVQHIAPFTLGDGKTGICAVSDDDLIGAYLIIDDGLEQVKTTADSETEDSENLRTQYDITHTTWLQHSPDTSRVLLCAGAHHPPPAPISEDEPMTDAAAEPFTPSVLIAALDPLSPPHKHIQCRLLGGHGDEVVRGVWCADDRSVAVSCGEDGFVRLWHADGAAQGPSRTERKGETKRFRPY